MGENAAIVRAMLEDYLRGDVDASLAHFHEEVEWRDQFGTYQGRQGVAESVTRWAGTWESLEMEITEMIEAGDHVVVMMRQTGRGRGSGVPVEGITAWLYTVRDGKIASARVYPVAADALRDAGLSD